ncbi:MAG: penicillin-binding transpeptidase domain-containing protein, partial [Candidatus Paceibacterota bacterium]
ALADRVGFTGGGGAIMDVHTGEILALTSFPEYDSAVMSDGTNTKKINAYLSDARKPFLDRVTAGLYTPGSIVKPYVAVGALEEGVISPDKEILSTGSISVPNPYDPEKKTVFNDWKAHGLVDMRHAIAVSSNVYFYEVGGGFGDQPGLGIERIGEYLSLFDIGKSPEEGFFEGPQGTIPSPEWKDKVFPGDPWRVGDTYYTAIGQYGFQVTPLQMLRAVSALANGGTLLHPSILSYASTTSAIPPGEAISVSGEHLQVAREGMRLGVKIGSASGLNVPYVEVAAKTGTAELGVFKQFVNSWVTGFFPYKDPRYAFVVIMERGPRGNTYGATFVMRELLDWMSVNAPEYLKP